MSELAARVRLRLAEVPGDLAAAVRRESGAIADDEALASMVRDVRAELLGAGVLEPLLGLAGVTDVLVNAPDSVWIDRGAGLERAAVSFENEASVRGLATRLATSVGRRLDDAQPFVDAVLADGTRLHAILPPLCRHTTLSLRALTRQRFDLGALRVAGAFGAEVEQLLRAVMVARLAVIISGGAGSGKTTLLAALLSTADPRERIVTIEDVAELQVQHPHVVPLVCRNANVEGSGEIGLRDLVRQAVRMRPDRVVVGEFRGAEILDLLLALNTGHEGGAATVHANSAGEVPARCEALGALGGASATATARMLACAIDVVVHLRRVDGVRVIEEIAMLDPGTRTDGALVVSPAWSRRGGVHPSGASALAELIAQRGAAVPQWLQ